MEGSVFRMLIYAIVVIALIFIITNYLIFHFQQEDISKLIERNLEKAMMEQGKYISEKAKFFEGMTISSRQFENSSRAIAFVCNSPHVCCHDLQNCPAGEECYKQTDACALKLSSDSVKVIKNAEALLSIRCSSVATLAECKIYIGKEPAQLEITNVEMKPEFNIENEKITMSFAVANIGQVDAHAVGVVLEIYKIVENSGKETMQFYSEQELESVEIIKPQNEQKFSPELKISDVGKFKVKINAHATDAGFDKKEKTFTVKGIAITPGCESSSFGSAELEDGMCVTKYYCNGCKFAYECLYVWKKKGKQDLELGTKEYAISRKAPIGGICQ